MKKTLALLLALVMCLSLGACGGGNNSPLKQSTNSFSGAFLNEPILLLDDESVKVEVLDFFEQEVLFATGKMVEKGFNLKLYNKTDHEIVVTLNGCLGADAIQLVTVSGSSSVMAGKNSQLSYFVHDYSGMTAAEMDSIEELYQLNGEITILHAYGDITRNSSYTAPFSFSAPVGNGSSDGATDVKAVTYNIGDTVSTDMVEFTLDNFDYVYHLDPKTYNEKEDIKGGSIGPGTDMVFANPEYTIRNIAKDTISAYEAAVFTIDYQDGYLFSEYDHVSYIVDVPGVARMVIGRGSSQGATLKLSPLSSENFDAYIPANALIDTDGESTLLLIVELQSSTGTETFNYKIR